MIAGLPYIGTVLAAASFEALWASTSTPVHVVAVILGCIVGLMPGLAGAVVGWVVYEYTLSLLDLVSISPIDLFCRRLVAACIGALVAGGIPGGCVAFAVLWLFS